MLVGMGSTVGVPGLFEFGLAGLLVVLEILIVAAACACVLRVFGLFRI